MEDILLLIIWSKSTETLAKQVSEMIERIAKPGEYKNTGNKQNFILKIMHRVGMVPGIWVVIYLFFKGESFRYRFYHDNW